MKKQFNILAACILLFSNILMADNKKTQIDSLKNILKTSYRYDTSLVNTLNKLSEYYIDSDVYDSSLYFASQSKDLAQRLRFYSGIASSLRLIGVVYKCQGEYSKSLTYLFQALKISESIKDNYMTAKIYNSIGTNYIFQKSYITSLEYLFKSISLNFNPIVYEDIARAYHFQGKDELSVAFYKKALSSDIPQTEKSSILNDLGDIYEHKNNLDSALSYYFKSLEITKSLNDNIGMCDAYGSIGDLMIIKKLYADAICYENKSLVIAKKINNKYAIEQSELSLSKIYESIGDGTASLHHYRNFVAVRDSMFNEENTKKTVQAQMQYDFDKKEAISKLEQDKKDAISAQEKQKQIIIIYSTSGGLFLVILFSIFIFRSLRTTRKQKNIIQSQKDEVFKQKEIVENQKRIIEEKSMETTQNIQYAKRIQDATMPSLSRVRELLPDSFIFNRGRDIVSGDFYFVEKVSDDKIIFAVADSTSHGVSGSMMSILNSNLISEAVRSGIHTPSKILDYVNTSLARAFHQTGESKEVKDGMDISICSYNPKTKMIEFSGAYNPLIIVRNKEIIELDADKLQLGQSDESYTNNEFSMQSGDMIYLSSDGYADQFGGDKNKKYKYKNFISLLCEISDMPTANQCSKIVSEFECWKNNFEQTDDVLVMGIRI